MLVALLSVAAGMATMPTLSQMEKTLAADREGNSYLAQNSVGAVAIYRVNPDGVVTGFWAEPANRSGARGYITALGGDGERLFAVRRYCDVRTNATTAQELLEINRDDSGQMQGEVLYRYQGQGLPNICSVTAQDGLLYLSSITQDGQKAYVDTFFLDGERPLSPTSSQQINSQFNNGFYYAAVFGGKPYIISKSGEVLAYEGKSATNIFVTGGGERFGAVTSISELDGNIRFFDNTSDISYDYRPGEGLSVVAGEQVTNLACVEAGNYRVYFNIDPQQGHYLKTGETGQRVYDLSFPLRLHVWRYWLPVTVALTAAGLLLALLWATRRALQNQRKLIIKFLLIMLPSTLVIFLGFGVLQTLNLKHTLESTRQVMVKGFNLLAAQSIDAEKLKEINGVQDYKTYKHRDLRNLLALTSLFADEESGQGISTESEVLLLHGGELNTGVSLRQPCGYGVQDLYSQQSLELFDQCLQTGAQVQGDMSDWFGQWTGAVCPVTDPGGNLVGLMVTRVSTSDIYATVVDNIRVYLVTILCLMLLMLLPILISFRGILAPLRTLEAAVQRVMDGHYDTHIDNSSNDEFMGISKAFNRMCEELSSHLYRLGVISNSYYRFVPGSMFELLGKESILEIEAGDSVRLDAVVCIVGIHNITALRAEVNDDLFLRMVSDLLLRVDRLAVGLEGLLVSGKVDFNRMVVLFRGNDATARGRDFALAAQSLCSTCRLEGWQGALDVTALLHRADIFYGITGEGDNLMPFLISADLDFLTRYLQAFAGSSARVLVTGAVHSELDTDCPTLHIGHALAEDDMRYELYELLEAYPAAQRGKKDVALFGRALEKFYNNEFYDARTLFTVLLRQSPEDGVLRWYVLACDHYYQTPPGVRRHDLYCASLERREGSQVQLTIH